MNSGKSTAAAEVTGYTAPKPAEAVRTVRAGHKLQPMRHRQNSYESEEATFESNTRYKANAPPSMEYNDKNETSEVNLNYEDMGDDVDEYEYFKRKYTSEPDSGGRYPTRGHTRTSESRHMHSRKDIQIDTDCTSNSRYYSMGKSIPINIILVTNGFPHAEKQSSTLTIKKYER